MFLSIFDTDYVNEIVVGDFFICLAISLVAGLLLAMAYTYKSVYTKSFVLTLAILPAVVSVVIIMVNGNVGTGVAVAGVFSLVRFRSVPGTAKEIGAIFIAMSSGLVFGMGYMAYGLVFALILSLFTMLYSSSNLGEKKNFENKTIIVTIPEDLNYTNVFDDLMEKYTNKHTMTHVKSTNMGSLFKISYNIELKDVNKEKEFIDEMRCRNGNLEISIFPIQTNTNEL